MSNSSPHDRCDKQSGCIADKQALRRSIELNAWLAVSAVTYAVALLLIRRHPALSPGWRAGLALTPILPGLFYLRNGMQLLREMDGLQRRIQVEAWLFAALGTVVISTVINVFNAQGIEARGLAHGLEVGGTYMTMFILWSVGVVIANLRYR
ncbi:MAG TPA: hypothetical protein VGG34_03935 [Opitutaceae bacterium]